MPVATQVAHYMDTLSSIDTFRQVVESGSFVAAAERLEVSPATVSKRIGPVPKVVLDDPLFGDLLIPVLPDSPLQQATLYLVHMRRKFVSPKVSAFIEFILHSLSHSSSNPPDEQRQVAAPRSIPPAVCSLRC